MSLEWARARLLQHAEALRKLCEAQAAARAQQLVDERTARRQTVVPLRKAPLPRALADTTATATVLKFAQPGRRRRA